jgi:hypothetical protein
MRLALAIASLILAACAGRWPRPPYSPQTTSALTELKVPLPPARVESIPDRPNGAAVWIDGEWSWRRARWSWSPGRWVDPPAGETFSPWVVVRGADGRLWYAPGTWHSDKGATVDAPRPLATAKVDSGEVVNASGATEPTGSTLRSGTPKAGR